MKGTSFFLVVIVAVAAYLVREFYLKAKKETEIITCPDGSVKGVVGYSRDGREYSEFLGIPYAKPPVGELRYEPPQPNEPWEGVRNAQNYGNKCPQLDLLFAAPTGDEDCLFLNIFSPQLPSLSKNISFPVMVFFHGGAYVFGAGTGYKPDFFMDENVILVTVNYRLNSFGFLNTGDGLVKGNMGLKDQSMSLRWIQRNIRAFGGDPDRVTIFGESAGGASVHLHLVSPMSKGLFHRGISQSGSALNPWTWWSDPARQAKRFCQKLGCPTDDSKKMIECMKKLPANEIMAEHKEILVPLRDFIAVFVPTLESGIPDENTFLSKHPRHLLKLGQYNKLPWMAGANAQDGLIFSAAIIRNDTVASLVYNKFQSLMPNTIMAKPDAAASAKIQDRYMPNLPRLSDIDSFKKLTEIYTERSFFNGIIESAAYQSSSSPVYLFQYSHRGEFRPANILIEVKRKYPVILEFTAFLIRTLFTKYVLRTDTPFYGVGHADELAMLFHMPWLSNVGRGHSDYEMSKAMVKLWTCFAYNRPLELLDVPWPVAGTNAQDFKFLDISMTPTVIDNPFKDSYKFWQSLNITPNL